MRRLLFATDFQPATNHAAQVAAHLTKALGMQTTALHVVDSSLPEVICRIRQAEGASMLEDLKMQFVRLGSPLTDCALSVNPIADAIVQKATDLNADLRNLSCSLLTVKQEDIMEELVEDDLRIVSSLLAEGEALHESGSYEQAATKFRQALVRNPFHLRAVVRLADILETIGDDKEAGRYRRRAELLSAQT